MPNKKSRVVHFEIPFDNKERAMKFYQKAFGWELVDMPTEAAGMPYVLVRAAKTDKNNMVAEKGAINGGLFPREAKAASPIIVIGVDSIDEKVKEIEAAGGKLIMPKVPIPNGHYARVSDSEGNIIGLGDSSK